MSEGYNEPVIDYAQETRLLELMRENDQLRARLAEIGRLWQVWLNSDDDTAVSLASEAWWSLADALDAIADEG